MNLRFAMTSMLFLANTLVLSGAAAAQGWTAPDGTTYPYCTTSGDNGGGFGWQPELRGPNGGSCKVGNTPPATTGGFASGTWYDAGGLAYPYCTTSGDNGGGFGWQPELRGPNGGSCRVGEWNSNQNPVASNDNGDSADNDSDDNAGNGGRGLIWVDLGGGNCCYGGGRFGGGRRGVGHYSRGNTNGGRSAVVRGTSAAAPGRAPLRIGPIPSESINHGSRIGPIPSESINVGGRR